MTDENKKEYCEWCWFHDYGNCNKCALGQILSLEKDI